MNTVLIKFFLILILTYLITNPIAAAATTDADWTQKEEITLEWGDSY